MITEAGEFRLMERPATRQAQRRSHLGAAAKDAICWLYLHCGYVLLRDRVLGWLGRSRAVVVYYHRVGKCDVLSKPVDRFRADLAYLKQHYECLTLGELCRRLGQGVRPRRPVAVVTFDDGYRDNYTQALPALTEFGVPATFFVATGFIGTDRDFPHDLTAGAASVRHPKLTWNDLREMEAAGFEIGSHTVNHANMGSVPPEVIGREVYQSLATLSRELGERPRTFSFPWGKPRDISTSAMEAVRSAGYVGAASAFGGANGPGTDRFHIRRVDVGNGHFSTLASRARIAGLDFDYLRLRLRQMFHRERRGGGQ